MLLFCVASRTDWQRASIPSESVLDMIVRSLIVDHPFDRLALTMLVRGGAQGYAAGAVTAVN
jgi:hypothetical protein